MRVNDTLPLVELQLDGAVGIVVDGDPFAQDRDSVVEFVVDRDADVVGLGVGGDFACQDIFVNGTIGGKSKDAEPDDFAGFIEVVRAAGSAGLAYADRLGGAGVCVKGNFFVSLPWAVLWFCFGIYCIAFDAQSQCPWFAEIKFFRSACGGFFVLAVEEAEHRNAIVIGITARAEVEFYYAGIPDKGDTGTPACACVGACVDLDFDESGTLRQRALGVNGSVGGCVYLAGLALVDEGASLV